MNNTATGWAYEKDAIIVKRMLLMWAMVDLHMIVTVPIVTLVLVSVVSEIAVILIDTLVLLAW